jgi:hypothetical protein
MFRSYKRGLPAVHSTARADDGAHSAGEVHRFCLLDYMGGAGAAPSR